MKRVPWGGTISRPLQYDGRHLDDEQDESRQIQQGLLTFTMHHMLSLDPTARSSQHYNVSHVVIRVTFFSRSAQCHSSLQFDDTTLMIRIKDFIMQMMLLMMRFVIIVLILVILMMVLIKQQAGYFSTVLLIMRIRSKVMVVWMIMFVVILWMILISEWFSPPLPFVITSSKELFCVVFLPLIWAFLGCFPLFRLLTFSSQNVRLLF